MIDKAELRNCKEISCLLNGKSRAVINVTVEEHVALMVVVFERTVIVHGTVIEFTDWLASVYK